MVDAPMGFYDSVKDSVRKEAQDVDNPGSDDETAEQSDDTMAFDQLKEDAEHAQDENNGGTAGSSRGQTTTDDTEIEILTSEPDTSTPDNTDTRKDGYDDERSTANSADAHAPRQDGQPPEDQTAQARDTRKSPPADNQESAADETVAAVLQRIEQQNDEMISLLRGIKHHLEQ